MDTKVERDWATASGLRAIVVFMPSKGHRCGYVEVPPGHPLYGQHYQREAVLGGVLARKSPEEFFDVHGDITFSAEGEDGYPALSDGTWFGFDCGHKGDYSTFFNAMRELLDDAGSPDGTQRGLGYVAAECEQLADQLAAVAQPMSQGGSHA